MTPFLRHGFVGGLSAADRECLLNAGPERAFAVGDLVMVQGALSDFVAVLVRGAVRVTACTEDGAEVTLSIRTPGDLLGDLGVIAREPQRRSATVVAITPLLCVLVGAQAFRRLLAERPDFAGALLQDLATRWQESNRRHVEFGAYSGEQRIARLLVELCRQHTESLPVDARSVTLDLPISQSELAGMVGVSRESAARVLAKLRRQRLISTGRRSLTIDDLPGLRYAGRLEVG